MGKPRDEIKEKTYYKDIYFLYDVLNSLKEIDEVKLFIKDLLTRSELRMMKRRWHVANMLSHGYEVRDIAQESKMSTGTVMRIKKILEEGNGGLALAIQRTHMKQKKELMYKKNGNKKGGSKYVKSWFS
jgi:TrpR-related protein YerC/YecD